MRIIAFEPRAGAEDQQRSWGILDGLGIIDLGRRPEVQAPTFLDALRTTTLLDLAMHAVGCPPDHDVRDVALLAPLPGPGTDGAPWEALGWEADLTQGMPDLALVVGTPTQSLTTDRDPLEYVAGCTLALRDALGPMVLTRDEWDRPVPSCPSSGPAADQMIQLVHRWGGDLARQFTEAARQRPRRAGDVVRFATAGLVASTSSQVVEHDEV